MGPVQQIEREWRREVNGLPLGAAHLGQELRDAASAHSTRSGERRLIAPELRVTDGELDVEALAERLQEGLGMLILDGLIAGRLELGRARVGWLLGAGDLVRPWESGELALTSSARWQVLRPSRIALLDADFNRRSADQPELTRTLLARSTRTVHWLMAASLIISAPLVEERLIMLFALLGERWGKVTPDGVLLELPLTHRLLASLCGSRRPSVTLALQALAREGLIERTANRGWLLHAEAADAHRLHPACAWGYAEALGFG